MSFYGLELSFDNASSWKTLYDTQGDPINCIDWGPLLKPRRRTIYWLLGNPATLYSSLDSGATIYTQYTLPTSHAASQEVVVARANAKVAYAGFIQPMEIWKTTDHGVSWSHLPTFPRDGNMSGVGTGHLHIAVHPDDEDFVLVGATCALDGGGTFFTYDGGTVWHELKPPNSGWGVAILPSSEWCVGLSDGSWEYIYDGPGWTPAFQTAAQAPALHYLSLAAAPVGGTRMIAVTGFPNAANGILVSSSRGAVGTWVDRHCTGMFVPSPNGASWSRGSVSSRGTYMYVAIDEQNDPQPEVWRSGDLGVAWSKILSKSAVIHADPVEDLWLWAWVANGDVPLTSTLMFSDNTGATWVPTRTQSGAQPWFDVAYEGLT